MDSHSFSKKKLFFFYKDIVLKYELELSVRPTGYNISKKAFSKYKKSNKIILIINKDFQDKIKQEKIVFKSTPLTCFFCKDSKSNQVVSLFAHLRNCFAHGRFDRIKIGKTNYLYLTDYKGSVCTMEAQIKESLLEEFIDNLLSLTK